jgi:hypothetical protein
MLSQCCGNDPLFRESDRKFIGDPKEENEATKKIWIRNHTIKCQICHRNISIDTAYVEGDIHLFTLIEGRKYQLFNGWNSQAREADDVAR